MHVNEPTKVTYGIMAEFDSAQSVVDAARRVVAEGYTKAEAYTPVPIEELNLILHKRRTFVPQISLVGGLAGMATGFALQYWAAVIEYPMNVGGRPFASWPAFVIPSYELTILFSALATTIGMIALNGLPPAVPPGVQRAAILVGELREVLSRDRGGRPEVPHGERVSPPARPRREGGL